MRWLLATRWWRLDRTLGSIPGKLGRIFREEEARGKLTPHTCTHVGMFTDTTSPTFVDRHQTCMHQNLTTLLVMSWKGRAEACIRYVTA